MFGPDSIVVATTDQRSTIVGPETVIAGLRTGNYYSLTAVGARVWQLVQTPIAVRDVQQTIAGEYDVAFERCAADVLELLESLRAEGLVALAL